MEPVAKTGHIAERQQATSEQPTVALFLAAFAAAATMAAKGNDSADAADRELADANHAATSWLDSLNASLRSDLQG